MFPSRVLGRREPPSRDPAAAAKPHAGAVMAPGDRLLS